MTSSIEGCSGAFWNGEIEERIEVGSGNNNMTTWLRSVSVSLVLSERGGQLLKLWT